MTDSGPALTWVPAGGLCPLRIRCLSWGGWLRCTCPSPAEPRPGAPGGSWGPAHPFSALLWASQDELSHINARLNTGILGCEYTPAAPAAVPEAPAGPSPISLPLCSL